MCDGHEAPKTTKTNCWSYALPGQKIDGIQQYLWLKKGFGGTGASSLGLPDVTDANISCTNTAGATVTGIANCKIGTATTDLRGCSGANWTKTGTYPSLSDVIYKQICVPTMRWVAK